MPVLPTLGRRALGIFLILLVVVIWVAAAVLIQVIFKDLDYNKPYFLTWFDSSWFVLYFAVFIRWKRNAGGEASDSYWKLSDDEEDGEGRAASPRLLPEGQSEPSTPRVEQPAGDPPKPKPTLRDIIRVAAIISPLWFIANYFDNAALALTSVASNTILSSCSGLFTVAVAALAGQERFNAVKLAAALCCLGGVAIIAVVDTKGAWTGDTLSGDLLALLSAFIYASARRALFWPGLIVLHFAGVEAWEPPSARAGLALLLNALVGSTLADLLWARSLLLTSPLVATLGLSMMIPLSMGADVALRGARFSPLYLLGAALVLAGFVAVNLEDEGGAPDFPLKSEAPNYKILRF
eukprot:tig00000310_g23965.t1